MEILEFETKEQRAQLLELVRSAAQTKNGDWSFPDLVDLLGALSLTLPEILKALELAQERNGGDFGDRLRDALTDHFLRRMDGRTLLAGPVQVVDLSVTLTRENKRRALVVLEIDPC